MMPQKKISFIEKSSLWIKSGLCLVACFILAINIWTHRREYSCRIPSSSHFTRNPKALNIMLVLMLDQNSPRWADAYVLVQSILAYRTCPLSLHLVTDKNACTLMANDFFDYHSEKNLDVSFIRPDMSLFSSVHTDFHGGNVMYKAIADQILPNTVDKVVIMDSDMIVLDDICKLHDEFNSFTNSTIAGLAPEQSTFYEARNLTNIPLSIPEEKQIVKGRNGINSGFILMDVKKARTFNFSEKMMRFVHKYQAVGGILPLGDQDVYNVYARRFPHFFTLISNVWNHQLNAFGFQINRTEYIRVLHANGNSKTNFKPYISDFWMTFANPKLEQFGIPMNNYSYENAKLLRRLIQEAHLAQFIRDDNYDHLKKETMTSLISRLKR